MSCPFRRCRRPTERNTTSSGPATATASPRRRSRDEIARRRRRDTRRGSFPRARPIAGEQACRVLRVGDHRRRTVIDAPGQPGQLPGRGRKAQLLAVQPADVRAATATKGHRRAQSFRERAGTMHDRRLLAERRVMARATRPWRPSEEGRRCPSLGALMDTRETSRGPSLGGSAAGPSCASTSSRRPVSATYTFSRRAPLQA